MLIFGRDIEETRNYAKAVINYAITSALQQVLGMGIDRVETTSIKATDPNAVEEGSDPFTFSLPVICGMVVSGLCILLGTVLLFTYMRKDRMRHSKLQKMAQRKMMKSLSGSMKYFTPDGTHIDESENLSCSSEISSVQIDFERGRVSKIPSNKVDILFDPDYASSCGASETSSRSPDRHFEATMSHPPHYLDDDGRFHD